MSEIIDRESGVPRYRFGNFVLDVADRQLWRGDTRVQLNARYLDALILLVREPGSLVDKDRFFAEVWHDVVVSDSALAQCIKEIRKQLGDDASSPRFIETVPRHGYRFVAEVESLEARTRMGPMAESDAHLTAFERGGHAAQVWRSAATDAGLATVGGGTTGIFVGLLYGLGLASSDGGTGTLSTLLVIVSLSVLAGAIGGFGVGLGLAGAGVARRRLPGLSLLAAVVGAAAGGLVVGASAKLLGVDAFNLLFGRAPAGITGGPEGAVLGGALALGALFGTRYGMRRSSHHVPPARARRYAALGAGLAGAVAGGLLPFVGGRMMGGSLDLVARSFSDSRLELDRFGTMLGEVSFGLATQVALGVVEGFLFGFCVIGAVFLIGTPAAYRYGASNLRGGGDHTGSPS